jgi:hypothetical protein
MMSDPSEANRVDAIGDTDPVDPAAVELGDAVRSIGATGESGYAAASGDLEVAALPEGVDVDALRIGGTESPAGDGVDEFGEDAVEDDDLDPLDDE